MEQPAEKPIIAPIAEDRPKRVVELSSRLAAVLFDLQPRVFPWPEDALVFANLHGRS